VIGAASRLLQFSKRHYLHYALLTAPLAALAIALSAMLLARLAPRRLSASPLARTLALPLFVLPFLRPQIDSGSVLYLFPPRWHEPVTMLWLPWRLDPAVARDLEAARSHVRPGEDVLVLPPRRNEVHLTLGIRSVSFPLGYGWAPASARAALASPGLRAVACVGTAGFPRSARG